MQHRSVLCEDPEVGCDQSIKPDAEQQCTNITCGIWDSEDWSEVSVKVIEYYNQGTSRSCMITAGVLKVIQHYSYGYSNGIPFNN